MDAHPLVSRPHARFHKTLRFYDEIKNKVVLVNFVFTSCGAACPLETAKLRQVQEVLGDRVGRDIFMYSISIDPDNATPAELKKYAAKFKVGPGWQFPTGKEADITRLRKKIGLYSDGEDRDDHSASLLVGNEATGQWLKRSTLDNPKVLAAVLSDRLFNYASANTTHVSYAKAPPIRKVDAGEDLYRRRCQVCHTVGAGDTVGPDLLGVTKVRDKPWLTRWISEPDKMLAEKDPIATALYAKYNETIMPNLRLSANDVEVLIGYLDAESKRVAAAGAAGKDRDAQPPHMREHVHTATAEASTVQ